MWALVESGGEKALVPRLIKEGEHFIRSTFFKFEGMVNISDAYIGHDSIHILNVVKGHVAKANCDNEPRLFGEGLHIVESPNFSYMGTVEISMKNLCISHGTITILQVPRGKIALLWKSNQPHLIDRPGLYEFNSNDVFFKEFMDSSARYIELGAKKGTFECSVVICIYLWYSMPHFRRLDVASFSNCSHSGLHWRSRNYL